RAVAGIGHYGNCVGVPTLGGEAVFDPAYAGNCLVNAMCVGLLPSDRVKRSGAPGPGNLVVLYGATTGRDGIGGASVLASQELGDGAAEKRPSVQVGDPFTGKKLIEVSVELDEDELVGDIPAAFLTEECPRYEVEQQERPSQRAPVSQPVDKSWIFEQYDQLVGSRTVRRPGLDAAVLRLRPSLRGLAVSLQGPPPGERDPLRSGVLAVLGAARNVACAGGEPLALTDCRNFGNPEKPETGRELEQAIEGIAQAAEALGIPVVSGNVSLYNDTDGRSIPPTPVVGCVGLVPDVRFGPDKWRRGDVVLVATAPGELD